MKIDKMSEQELRRALRTARCTVNALLASHTELMAGVPNIVCDFGLLNDSRIAAEKMLRDIE
jgi:hypothetical protein